MKKLKKLFISIFSFALALTGSLIAGNINENKVVNAVSLYVPNLEGSNAWHRNTTINREVGDTGVDFYIDFDASSTTSIQFFNFINSDYKMSYYINDAVETVNDVYEITDPNNSIVPNTKAKYTFNCFEKESENPLQTVVFAVVEREEVLLPSSNGWICIPKDEDNNVTTSAASVVCYDYYKFYKKDTEVSVLDGSTYYDDSKFTVLINDVALETLPSEYTITDPTKVKVEVRINDLSKYKWDNADFLYSSGAVHNASNGLINYSLADDIYQYQDNEGNYIADHYYAIASNSRSRVGFINESENYSSIKYEVSEDGENWTLYSAYASNPNTAIFALYENKPVAYYKATITANNSNFAFYGDFKEGQTKTVYMTLYSKAEYTLTNDVIDVNGTNFIDFDSSKTYSFVTSSDKFTTTYSKKNSDGETWTVVDNVASEGEYKAELKLNDGYIWSDTTLDDKTIYVTVSERQVLDYPTIDTEQFTNGDTKILFDNQSHQIFSGIDFTNCTVTFNDETITSNDDLKVTHTNEYKLSVSINDPFKYKWSDGEVNDFKYTFYVSPYAIGKDPLAQIYGSQWGYPVVSDEGDIHIVKYSYNWVYGGFDLAKTYLESFDENHQLLKYGFHVADVSMSYTSGITGETSTKFITKASDVGTYVFDFVVNNDYVDDFKFTMDNGYFTHVRVIFEYNVCDSYHYDAKNFNFEYTGKSVGTDEIQYSKRFSMQDTLEYTVLDETLTKEYSCAVEPGNYKIKYQLKDECVGNLIFHYMPSQGVLETADDYFIIDATITKKSIYVSNNILDSDDGWSYEDSKYIRTFNNSYAYLIYLGEKYIKYFDVAYYSITDETESLINNTKVLDAGSYKALISIKDDVHYTWNTQKMDEVLSQTGLTPVYDEDTNLIGYSASFEITSYDVSFYLPSNIKDLEYTGYEHILELNSDAQYCAIRFEDYKVYNKDTFVSESEPGEETILKEVGEYIVVIPSHTSGSVIYTGRTYEVEIYPNYVRYTVEANDIEYGITFEELKNKVATSIDNIDLIESAKEEILNHEWVLTTSEEKCDDTMIYNASNFDSIVPGTYYVFFRLKDANGEYTNEYYYNYETSSYDVSCMSSIVINKKNVNVEWTENDFTYTGSNQFNNIKAYYVDANNNKVSLIVSNTVDNDFTCPNEYLFFASFDESLNNETFNQNNYYALDNAQINYNIKKASIDWNNVKFEGYNIEYSDYLADTTYQYQNNIIVVGLPEEVEVSYDFSNIRAYKGKYDITATLSSNNYEIPSDKEVLHATLMIAVKKEVITKQDDDIAIVEAVGDDNLLDPSLRLIVVKEVEDVHEDLKEEIKEEANTSWTEQVISVYDVKLIDENNIVQQPNGKLRIALKVPQEILDGDFRIFHRHENADGSVKIYEVNIQEVVDGYAYFEVDELSEFVFTYNYTSLIWLMILLGVLSLLALALLVIQIIIIIKKGINFKKSSITTLAAAPVFYMEGHVEAVTAIAIVLGVLLVLNLAAFLFYKFGFKPKKEKKVEKIVEPKKEEVKETSTNEVVEDTTESVSLKESMAKFDTIAVNGEISKKSIANYINENYANKTVVNCRENYTAPSKGNKEGLPLADTHYVKNNKGSECFTYVYENKNGAVLLLLKLTDEDASKLKEKHSSIVVSRFPKVSHGLKYYSLPIDETYNFNEIKDVINTSISSVSALKEKNI